MSRPNFTTPLLTIDAAKAWIEAMDAAGMMFHFEDSPDSILKGGTDSPLFSEEESEDVAERVAELYELDWTVTGHECPIGYALQVADEEFTPTIARLDEEYAAMISVHKFPDIGVSELLKTDLDRYQRHWAEAYLRRREAVQRMAANYEPPASALDDGRDFTHPYEP